MRASDRLRANVAEMMIPSIRMPCYQWACDSMAEANHYPDLGSIIAAPTLVVVGEHDEVTPPRASQRLAEGIAGCSLCGDSPTPATWRTRNGRAPSTTLLQNSSKTVSWLSAWRDSTNQRGGSRIPPSTRITSPFMYGLVMHSMTMNASSSP